MKALTICQPYAHLILMPGSEPRMKRAENRSWPTNYRGPLIIHAGKSRSWLDEDEDGDVAQYPDMAFGAIVGLVDQVACLSIDAIRCGAVPESLRWLVDHDHCEGPWCHIYANPRRLREPIPYRGQQGLFEIPDAVVKAGALAASGMQK